MAARRDRSSTPGPGFFNLRDKDYMWHDDKSPHVSGKGAPKKDSGQWVADGVPDSW